MMKLKRKNYSVRGKIASGIIKGRDAMRSVMHNPGRLVNETVIKPTIETPLTAGALKPLPVPGSSLLIKPLGRGEKYIQEKLGLRKKFEKAADRYGKSKFGQGVEQGVTNFVHNIHNYIPM